MTAVPSTPRVTVVVAAYQVGEDIRPTIDSVLAQTMGDLELLVVDDGSPDRPVPEDLPDDPRLIVDRRPVNGGYAAVTNHAIARARGEWVVFVDADDLIEPDYLAVMLEAGERFGADAVLAPILCVRDGHEIGTQLWNPPPGSVSDEKEAMRRLLRNDIAGSQHVLLRRPTVTSPRSSSTRTGCSSSATSRPRPWWPTWSARCTGTRSTPSRSPGACTSPCGHSLRSPASSRR